MKKPTRTALTLELLQKELRAVWEAQHSRHQYSHITDEQWTAIKLRVWNKIRETIG